MKTLNEEGLLHTIATIDKDFAKKTDIPDVNLLLNNIHFLNKYTVTDFDLFLEEPSGIYIYIDDNPQVIFTETENSPLTITKGTIIITYVYQENNEECLSFHVINAQDSMNYIGYYKGNSIDGCMYGLKQIVYNKYFVKNTDVLTKNNTKAYTPTSNYHPSTKKYVDDSIKAVSDQIGSINTVLATLTTVGE